jgi:tetratricopeptide (TPR) repeat protein
LLPLVSLGILLANPQTSLADSIRWRSDYGTVLKEASEKGLPIFLNVGTINCYWCKQLDARTFVNEEIIRLLNERCIPLKLDANNPAHATLVLALRVQSYPTLIFAGPDGAILSYREGFLEAPALKEQVGKVLVAVGTPDWMKRDFEAANKAITDRDYARAITLLKGLVEDGKSRPLQVKARLALADLEKKASEDTARARELAEKGKTAEAIQALDQVNKVFPGTLAARRGKQLIADLASKSSSGQEDRKRQAAEILRLAREDYKNRQFLCALDRCEDLTARFGDLPEAGKAEKIVAEIKESPEWAKKAADQLGERLCDLYLSLADNSLKKGQPQQAIFYLERITKLFPGSRHADLAAVRLARLRGPTGMK